jgi:polar amino acid transport system substrate-binding protein
MEQLALDLALQARYIRAEGGTPDSRRFIPVKRFIPIAGVAAAALTATAALAAPASAPTRTPGVLVVGFGDPAVGFAVGTVRGSTITNPKGYEVDLSKAIAKSLKIRTVKYIYTPWTKLFAPGAKDFDISFQEATITAARRKTVDFTAPYLNANQGVLISKNATAPTSLADLKQMQTCAQVDTTGLDYIQTRLKPAKKPLVYQTTTAAFTAVQIGRCEALILDVPIVALQKKSKPGAYGAVAGQIVTHEQYGAVLQKHSKLTPMVSAAIKKLTKNGTIAKLQKKWFNLNFSKIPTLK